VVKIYTYRVGLIVHIDLIYLRKEVVSTKLQPLLLLLAVGLCAIFFGILSSTANPLLIGIGLSLIIGPFLLIKPELTIWLILIIGFLFGVITASPKYGKFAWFLSILSTLLLLPSFLNMVWSKRYVTPNFIKLALVFMLYAILVSLIHGGSMQEFVGGFKRYFQSYGLMLALFLTSVSANTYRSWTKFLLVAALLQFPFALYELLVLVPLRGGLALSSETTDVVAGTFGANLEGGSPNTVMVIFLFIAVAFLVARKRSGVLSTNRFILFTIICLLPLGMGETKIAVIMLPLVGLILLKKDLTASPSRAIPMILGLGVFTALLGYLYVALIMNSTLETVINNTLRYNVGDQGYSKGVYLNRFTSITFWFEQQGFDDPLSFLIGNGIGSSYVAEEGISGHIGLRYPNYAISLTSLSTLLWDTGIIGLSLFTGIFISAWKAAGRLIEEVKDPVVRQDGLAIQAAISLFLLSFIYSDMIVNLVSFELIYAIILGYLAYLMNQHGLLRKTIALPY
jgi:hypothetical protein